MIKEERLKSQKRKRRRKRLLITFLVLLLLLGSAFIVLWKLFTVENVEVEGNALYEDSVISETLLKDDLSWNSMYVFLKYKFKKPEDIPFIDTVSVSMKDPHTIVLNVYEKPIIGYFYDEGLASNVYFDKDGVVVEMSDRIIEGIPKIYGLNYEEIEIHQTLSVSKSVLTSILNLTQALKKSDLVPERIEYGRENSPILIYGEISVQLGGIDLLSQKIERILQILPSLKGEKGVLHLESWTEGTSNIIFDRDE